MRASALCALILGAGLAVSGCAKPGARSDERRFAVQGQVVSKAPDRQEANIKNDEIKGFMPAMTMPYKIRDAGEFAAIKPGDLIAATLVVESSDAYLTDVKRVGQAPLATPADDAALAVTGAPLLKPGEPIPVATFTDQDGRKRTMASYQGSPLVITFMYTRCPFPTFCPLMDHNFAAIQRRVEMDPSLHVKLASISFDPADTPAVLKKHAEGLGAEARIWNFYTGPEDEIDRFAGRFGVLVMRSPTDPRDITHNLRTVIVDRQGRLVKTYTGNEWTPDQVIADLKALN